MNSDQRKQLKRIAREYRCDPKELVDIAIEELIAAHQHAPKAERRSTYEPKPCARCKTPFTPSGSSNRLRLSDLSLRPLGPRGIYCPKCREDAGLEPVWNGEMGKQGVSLTGR